MNFAIGQHVCHPSHGPGQIINIDEQTFQSKAQKYYVVRIFGKNLTSRIPLNAIDKVGLRAVISEKQTEKVLSTLQQEPQTLPTNPTKRQSQLKELIFSGRPTQIARAIRELSWKRFEEGRLTLSDKKLLKRGKEMLVAEVAIATDVEQKSVRVLIDDTLGSALKTWREPKATQSDPVHVS